MVKNYLKLLAINWNCSNMLIKGLKLFYMVLKLLLICMKLMQIVFKHGLLGQLPVWLSIIAAIYYKVCSQVDKPVLEQGRS